MEESRTTKGSGVADEAKRSENASTPARNEPPKKEVSKDEEKSSKDMQERARKSYHHDGPGGSYQGY